MTVLDICDKKGDKDIENVKVEIKTACSMSPVNLGSDSHVYFREVLLEVE